MCAIKPDIHSNQGLVNVLISSLCSLCQWEANPNDDLLNFILSLSVFHAIVNLEKPRTALDQKAGLSY